MRAQIAELERRTRTLPPCRIDCMAPGARAPLLSVGTGARHVILVGENQVPFLKWLGEHILDDLSDAPILLIGDRARAGQEEAAPLAALLLAITRGWNARLHPLGPVGFEAMHALMARLLPPSWQDQRDLAANHYPLGLHHGIEIASLRQRSARTTCDVAVVDYLLGSPRAVGEALESAPVQIIHGEPPEKDEDQWICDGRDAAHAKGRLFRFQKPSRVDPLVDHIHPEGPQAVAAFWRAIGTPPTGKER